MQGVNNGPLRGQRAATMKNATEPQPDHIGLLSVLVKEEEARLRESHAQWATLLRRGNPADSPRLAELMKLLGKTAAQAAEDLKILQHYDNQAAVHARARVPGMEDRRVAARKAAEEYAAETDRLIEERRKEQYRLDEERSDLEHVFLDGQDAGHAMHALRLKHPDLLPAV